MALTYHKAVADTGGTIGAEIFSGDVGTLLPKVLLSEQTTGTTISRKFFIASDATGDVSIDFTLEAWSEFATIVFESTGDAQVVGDLTGSEVNESPITVVIPASGHKSFWLQVEIPTLSAVAKRYNTIDCNELH